MNEHEHAQELADDARSFDDAWFAEQKQELTTLRAENERLKLYRARMEEAHGERLYAIEKLLDHFDNEGNLKGDGQWRIREIWQCCKDFDEGSEKAARLSGESLIAENKRLRERLAAAEKAMKSSLLELKVTERFLDETLGAHNLGDYTHKSRRSVLTGLISVVRELSNWLPAETAEAKGGE